VGIAADGGPPAVALEGRIVKPVDSVGGCPNHGKGRRTVLIRTRPSGFSLIYLDDP
jgi:hypothetical protein